MTAFSYFPQTQERAELKRHMKGGMIHSSVVLPPAPLPWESTTAAPAAPALSPPRAVLVLGERSCFTVC